MSMASSVYLWFNSEVCFWRSLASTVWSIICLPFIMLMFLLLSGFSATHPLHWLHGILNSVTSLHFWISFLVFTICMLMVEWFSLPHLTVIPQVETSHLTSALGLLRWSRLPLMVVCSVAGTLSAWSVSRLMGDGFTSLTYVLDTETYERTVLREQHLFVVLGGIFTGLCYYKQFFHRRHYYLAFPNVQRFKLFQVRSDITPLVKSCMWQSLHIVKYFYITYFLLGGLPKTWIKSSFSISVDPNALPLNSVMGLLNLALFWQTFLCTVLLTFTWSFARTLTKIFHTEHLEFPITTMMEYDRLRTLPEALACAYCPLLQHLAFLDLSCVSKFSRARRQELLSLSQPGGHPRIWSSVSVTALGVVKELSDRVRQENWAIMSKVSLNAQRDTVHPVTGSYRYPNFLAIFWPKLQNLILAMLAGDANSASFLGHDTTQGVDGHSQEEEKTSVLFTKIHATLRGLPIITHLLAESPDVNSRRLFASCQLQIWAVEALSHIAAKSFLEDKYGVVQPALPTIIGTLLDLHEAIEKHFKLTTGVVRRPGSSVDPLSDALLRYKLHTVNKAAIYRIVNTYKQHLEDLRLSPEYTKKLQPFSDYCL